MREPIVFVPGLLCSAEVFAPPAAAPWPLGPVTVASTLVGATTRAIAAAILQDAPERFALAGISMGGYRTPYPAGRRLAQLVAPMVGVLARSASLMSPSRS